MASIQAQLKKGEEKWGGGIDLQSDNLDIKDVNDFIKFKILEYEAAELKDDDM